MRRFLSKYSVLIIVCLCLALALFLRIVVPYHLIFTDYGVRFAEADPYLHMRLVDNTLAHFPLRTPFDPYTFFPEGAPVYYPPLFTLFLSGTIWVFSLGAPTAASIDTIGALFPAILGALTVIPIFFIGRALFNKWAGVLAALLIAVMPGEFLGRTMLGFTDHHVAEIFFSTTAMLFLILALKAGTENDITLKPFDRRKVKKPALFSLLAGLFLGLYLQMWAGGPIFILILFVYFVVQFVINHLRRKSSVGLLVVATATMLTASFITLPFLPRYYSRPLYFIALGTATMAPVALFLVSRLLAKTRLHPAFYPVCLAGMGMAVFGLVYAIDPALVKSLLANFNIISPATLDLTIGEVEPLLFPAGNFSFSVAWLNFTTGFFSALIALGIIIYQIGKQGAPSRTLVVIWSLVMLVLTLGQRRFAYYYAVNVALLTAFLVWMVFTRMGLKERFGQTLADMKKERRGSTIHDIARKQAWQILAVTAVFFVVVAPNFPPALTTVKQVPFAPDKAWEQTLTWLRDNSPSPFGENDLYYAVTEKTNPGLNFDYPASAYGVMAWWDYGHWITRIAHRIPNHAPGGGRSAKVAECFLSQDEESARELTRELGSLYLIVDYPTVIFKFYAVCEWAGVEREDYFDVYYQEQDGLLKPIFLFYPEFFKTLLVRLYSFEGREVTPQVTTVIAYQTKQAPDGTEYKEVTDAKQFKTYTEAQAFLAGKPAGMYRIVSTDPFTSPVPLTALDHYRLTYRSAADSTPVETKHATPVKIFIYLDDEQLVSNDEER